MNPHEHVILEIARERERQMDIEGWTPDHDDQHASGELASAAACYAIFSRLGGDVRELLSGADASLSEAVFYRRYWPWGRAWWKPTTPRRDLIKAAALIVAEVERLDRLSSAGKTK